ncbi:MAG: hypothetical protein MZU91_05130 [Desulfosudis oleivorans]|nr:hypothetical protein [Desulfosudis oleivorans]
MGDAGLLSQHRDPAGLRQSSLKERAETLLGDLGLPARKDHKPGELSGGEQQRVAVARGPLPGAGAHPCR